MDRTLTQNGTKDYGTKRNVEFLNSFNDSHNFLGIKFFTIIAS